MNKSTNEWMNEWNNTEVEGKKKRQQQQPPPPNSFRIARYGLFLSSSQSLCEIILQLCAFNCFRVFCVIVRLLNINQLCLFRSSPFDVFLIRWRVGAHTFRHKIFNYWIAYMQIPNFQNNVFVLFISLLHTRIFMLAFKRAAAAAIVTISCYCCYCYCYCALWFLCYCAIANVSGCIAAVIPFIYDFNSAHLQAVSQDFRQR